jgi:oxygen-independent coproporphyrinogen-3 oxidase
VQELSKKGWICKTCEGEMASVYVHVPFCERKCLYCDFYSVTDREALDAFLRALVAEMRLVASADPGEPVQSIFFGGGTPSVLRPAQLEIILSSLRARFRISPDAEISLEANPGTVGLEQLEAFRSLGVNRLSFGIQSFHDADLRFLGRIHDSAQANECLALARAAGFDNVGIDLIYSIPGQTLAGWDENLRHAVDLAPEHLSAYSLIVEEHTPLHRMVGAGQVRVSPTDLVAAMYERAMERLEASGYEHYEVSNYARPGFRCRHNSAYWSHAPYLGFGPSAHSFQPTADGRQGRRWWNVADLGEYRARVERGVVPVESEERLGAEQLLRERIFLELRSGGLALDRLATGFGEGAVGKRQAVLRGLIQDGLAILEGQTLRLTRPGYVLCDEIGARLCGG